MSEQEQALAEFMDALEIISATARALIATDPDSFTAFAELAIKLAEVGMIHLHQEYDDAGQPYGNSEESMWRWWRER